MVMKKKRNYLLLFCIIANKCTIISQIITLLHVSTLSCHPQTACNQYLAKLHKYYQTQLLVMQFTINMFHVFALADYMHGGMQEVKSARLTSWCFATYYSIQIS
jgi:hypothetical protein